MRDGECVVKTWTIINPLTGFRKTYTIDELKEIGSIPEGHVLLGDSEDIVTFYGDYMGPLIRTRLEECKDE